MKEKKPKNELDSKEVERIDKIIEDYKEFLVAVGNL